MSKPSEAKILLQTLYNAEVGSRVDYDTYSTCLEEIGFETSPRGYYIVGFPTHDLTSTKVLKKQGKDCSGESYSVPKKLLSQDKDQLINTLKKMKSLFSKNSFTAFAIGNFSWPREESGLDIWSINDKKQLTHLQKPKIKRYMSFVDNILDIGL